MWPESIVKAETRGNGRGELNQRSVVTHVAEKHLVSDRCNANEKSGARPGWAPLGQDWRWPLEPRGLFWGCSGRTGPWEVWNVGFAPW